VKSVTSLAGPLGVAYFHSYGEWELLTLFARALGPAEVVSWAMLGYIWSMLKYTSDGIVDAAEGRCALYLVTDQPEYARHSAHKSMFLGLVFSTLTTSVLFIAGMDLAEWITQDATLRRLLIETFPLIGIGNIVQSTVIVIAAILGAQGRSGLATMVQFVGNWCVTIPLSGIFTYGLRIDLQGLTSAVVLGLAMSAAGNTYMLVRSEWDALASIASEGFALDYCDPIDDRYPRGGGGAEGILYAEDEAPVKRRASF
jgi:Na+-driven multidrug efflux pump